jgi:hypothetical protein
MVHYLFSIFFFFLTHAWRVKQRAAMRIGACVREGFWVHACVQVYLYLYVLYCCANSVDEKKRGGGGRARVGVHTFIMHVRA